jgi:tRNA-uridine 2-sulfurtransferase
MARVVVGLSGGVDSAVAALLLQERGGDVRAATLELWPSDDERGCCSPAAVRRAHAVAARLGVPHDVVSEREAFTATVIEPFTAAYLEGETPNPCIACNPWRTARLARLADAAGAEHVATGHYARIVRRAGRAFVARGRDAAKDQSYMLWRVSGPVLDRLLLPLGELDKPSVRARARVAGLPAAGTAESQEVCFAPDGYRRFLTARGVAPREGDIVAEDGRVLGRHRGAWRYTVGQRRGLGVSSPEPLYVLGVDARSGRVTVGPRSRLAVSELTVRGLHDYDLGDGRGLAVQLRYRSPAVGVAELRALDGDRAVVRLAEPFEAAAPGQAAVFYRRDVVVGGATIDRSPFEAGAGERPDATDASRRGTAEAERRCDTLGRHPDLV